MSGTSMDGLDLAFCTFWEADGKHHFQLEQAETVPFDGKWRSRLNFLPQQSAEIYAKTNVFFGHWLGQQINAFVDRHQLQPQFVAVHGQTIFHQPQKSFTAQIGEGETIATYLPCPIVTNFRSKDLALKGEGAPLIVLGEQLLFPDYQLFLNLGGIANISFQHQAFDVCPCNGILNAVYKLGIPEDEQGYDQEGAIAATGAVDEDLFQALNGLSYYRQPPPKTLGWEWVAAQVLPIAESAINQGLPVEDCLATLVEHVAFQIARAADKIDANGHDMLITGGGKHHTFFMERLAVHLRQKEIGIVADVPDDWVDFKEAIVFGFLGLRTLQGAVNTVHTATGAQQASVSGSIHLPTDGGGYSLL